MEKEEIKMPNKKEEKNTAIKIVAVVIVILVVLTIRGIAWYLGLINFYKVELMVLILWGLRGA